MLPTAAARCNTNKDPLQHPKLLSKIMAVATSAAAVTTCPPAFVRMFGETLQTAAGTVQTAAALAEKEVVGYGFCFLISFECVPTYRGCSLSL
jgi:hypothetical protein